MSRAAHPTFTQHQHPKYATRMIKGNEAHFCSGHKVALFQCTAKCTIVNEGFNGLVDCDGVGGGRHDDCVLFIFKEI